MILSADHLDRTNGYSFSDETAGFPLFDYSSLFSYPGRYVGTLIGLLVDPIDSSPLAYFATTTSCSGSQVEVDPLRRRPIMKEKKSF